MYEAFKKLIKTTINLGVDPNDNSRFARNIRLTNYFVILAFICCTPVIIFNFSNDTSRDQITLFIYAIANSVIFYLNYKKLYNSSRTVLVLGGNLILFYFSDIQGKGTGIPLYFFLMMVIPYLFFEFKDWKYILFLNFITVFLFVILEYNEYSVFPFDNQKTEAEQYFDFRHNLSFVFIALTAILIYFSYEFYKTENNYFKNIEALRLSENLTKTIIEINNDAIWLLDDKYRLINCNKGFRNNYKEIFNVDLKEGFDLVNDSKGIRPEMKMLWESDQKKWKEHYNKALKEGNFKTYEHTKIHGVDVYTELTFYRIINPDGSKIVVVFSRNITEQKIAETKIKGNLSEKIILLKEVHHRVKNNLQIIIGLLQLQELYMPDELSKKAFRQSEDRIKAMALVHELLYQTDDLSRVNFSEYIGRISTSLLQSYLGNSKNISLNINCKNIYLPIDTAIPLGLLFNELMTNALKYAFVGKDKGEIYIGLKKSNDTVEFEFADNGIGMDEKMMERKSETLGITMVKRLVDQINATLEINVAQGTKFLIKFVTP